MKQYNVIFIALARWDGQYSSTAFSIASHWSESHRIFYIDNPYTITDFLRNMFDERIKMRRRALLFGNPVIGKNDDARLIYICPPLILPINWLPKGFIYNFFNNINNRIFFSSIRKVIKIFKISDYLIFNSFNPFYSPFPIKFLAPIMNIYQSVDNMEGAEYINKHGSYLEKSYVRKADLTITTSSELRKKLSQFSKKVTLIPNAANFELFSRAMDFNLDMPDDFPVTDKPVICYTGNICQRIDYDLLLKIAIQLKDHLLILIGPLSINNKEIITLQNLENVYFLGGKKINQLPGYLKFSDCTIIPFKLNELTGSIYPLKINEYLSAGKPTVTTKFSEDILTFKDMIYIAEDHDHFISLLKNALNEKNPEIIEKRILTAKNNTWENRVEMLQNEIEKIYYGKE